MSAKEKAPEQCEGAEQICIAFENGQHNVYRGNDLVATIHGERATRANGRLDTWNVCRMDGSVKWHVSLEAACVDASNPDRCNAAAVSIFNRGGVVRRSHLKTARGEPSRLHTSDAGLA